MPAAWILGGRGFLAVGAAEAAANAFAQPQLLHHPLQPDQRAHPREQRNVVDRLGQEIVGAGLEAAQPVGDVGQGGDHDDRNVGGAPVGLQLAADFEAVHARHHHVEQDDVGRLGIGEFEGARGRYRRSRHIEIFARQLGFEQLDVGFDVVNNQDSAGHQRLAPAVGRRPPQERKRSTVRMKLATEIGLAI